MPSVSGESSISLYSKAQQNTITVMKVNPLVLLASIVILLAAQISALAKPVWKSVKSLPYSSEPSHKFESHQYAYTQIAIDEDGSLLVKTVFENGAKIDGDHFYCRIELFDASTNRIAVARQEAGVDAKGLGKPVKRTRIARGKISSNKISNIRFVQLTYGHFDEVDDEKFWNNVKKAARVIGEIVVAAKTGDFALLHEDYMDNEKVDGSPLKTQSLKDKIGSGMQKAGAK